MPFDRNALNTTLRDIVSLAVNKRDTFLTVDEAERINDTLLRASHRVPLFIHSFLSGDLSSDEINQIFDQINVDHSIMLKDVQVLYEIIRSLEGTINEKIIRPRLSMKSTIGLIQNFIDANPFGKSYNKIDIVSATETDNLSTNREKLVVDRSTGTIRLSTTSERVFSSKEDLDISYTVLTNGLTVYEESPPDYIFDPQLVYYVAAHGKAYVNKGLYKNYTGMVVAFDIVLPTVTRINNIRIRFGSDILQDVLSIIYTSSNSIEYLGQAITDYKLVSNGLITEIEFPTVEAFKIRLVLGSRIKTQVTSEFVIPGETKKDFIPAIEKEVHEILADRQSFRRVLPQTTTERLNAAITVPNKTLDPGTEFLIMPLRGLEISERKYSPFGVFRTQTKSLEGNISYVTVETKEVPTPEVLSLVKVVINGKFYTLVPLGDDGRVTDAAVVNLSDSSDPAKRYYIETNLIPADPALIESFFLGSVINPSNLNLAGYEVQPNGVRVYIAPTSVLVPGNVLTLKYAPATFDRNGIAYDPRSLDVISIIGKPNARNQKFASRTTNSVYFYDSAGKIARYHFDEVRQDPEGNFLVGPTTKGEDLTGDDNQTYDEVETYTDLIALDSPPEGDIRRVLSDELINGVAFLAGLWKYSTTSGSWAQLRVAEKLQSGPDIVWRLLVPHYGLYEGGYAFIQEELIVGANNSVLPTYPYVIDMVIASTPGNAPLTIATQYSRTYGTRDEFREGLTVSGGVVPGDKVILTYFPIPQSDGTLPAVAESNIERHNVSLNYKITRNTTDIVVDRYPFVDISITNSARFTYTRGLYYFNDRASIIYEPYIIYNEGNKLEFGKHYDVQGRRIIFKVAISGNVQIRFYTMADNIAYQVEMLGLDPRRDDTTGRLLSLNGLLRVKT